VEGASILPFARADSCKRSARRRTTRHRPVLVSCAMHSRQLATARVAASQPWPSARLAVPADESIRSLEATATDQRFSVSRVHYATGVFGNGEPGPSTFA